MVTVGGWRVVLNTGLCMGHRAFRHRTSAACRHCALPQTAHRHRHRVGAVRRGGAALRMPIFGLADRDMCTPLTSAHCHSLETQHCLPSPFPGPLYFIARAVHVWRDAHQPFGPGHILHVFACVVLLRKMHSAALAVAIRSPAIDVWKSFCPKLSPGLRYPRHTPLHLRVHVPPPPPNNNDHPLVTRLLRHWRGFRMERSAALVNTTFQSQVVRWSALCP